MDADRIADHPVEIAPDLAQRLPRGVRENNPLNLRPTKTPWIGEIAPVDGYCAFATAFCGVRAGAKNLLGYQVLHGLDTVRGIITRWAPPEENDTEAYIKAVCRRTKFDPDAHLNLGGVDTLRSMVVAMIWQEQGMQPYDDDTILQGVMHALT